MTLVLFYNNAAHAFVKRKGPDCSAPPGGLEFVKEPPELLTEERHRIISSMARFTVSDYEQALKRLSGEYDFADEEEIPAGGVHFS